jgi:hypothetical protein
MEAAEMTLFDPPADKRIANEPVTLKRLGWSVSRGVLLGCGLAALSFAYPWAGELFADGNYDPWIFLVFAGLLGAIEFWMIAKSFTSNRIFVLLTRGLAVALGGASVVYLFNTLSQLRLTEWAQGQPEFVSLVVVCAIVGLLALRGGFRLWLHQRDRAVLWFAAALAVWFAGEWSVKLGTIVDWRDPRPQIAFQTIIGAGVLVMIGLLALMDWHMRRREGDAPIEHARSEQNGLNNG